MKEKGQGSLSQTQPQKVHLVYIQECEAPWIKSTLQDSIQLLSNDNIQVKTVVLSILDDKPEYLTDFDVDERANEIMVLFVRELEECLKVK